MTHDMEKTRRTAFWLLLLCGAFQGMTRAQYAETQRLVASDAYPFGRFGIRVALEGDTALVADDNHRFAGVSVGGVYVLQRVGGQWTEVELLQPADLVQVDRFGVDLALEGDWALVGTTWHPGPSFQYGAVYVFHRTPIGWRQTQKIMAPDFMPSAGFGNRIAIDGDRALIAASGHTTFGGQGSGQVYVYERSGLQWNYVQTLLPSIPESLFGWSTALEGEWAIVSAHNHDAPHPHILSGAAYVFRHVGSTFVQHAVLQASIPTRERAYGKYMDMRDGTLVVSEGDPWAFFASQGRIHVYSQSDASPTGFVHEGVFYASDGYLDDQFAVPPSGGSPIEIQGDRIVVGASSALEAGVLTGAAYVFDRIAGQWGETARLQWSAAEYGDAAGSAVALDGSTVFVSGSGIATPAGIEGGGIYVYEAPLGAPYCTGVPTSTGAVATTWVLGHAELGLADVTLRALDLPPQEFGYFLASKRRGFTAGAGGSAGNLCLDLPIVRFASQVARSGPAGVLEIAIDPGVLPTAPASAILAGETWNFQAWFRDHDPALTSNFSEARAVRFW